MVSDVKLRSI